MSAPAWMPLYIAEYIADTGHLSTIEHGAYGLLMMHYWQNNGLPTEDVKLARIARMTAEEWAAVRDTMYALFKLGNWRHKRIDAELAATAEMINKRSAAGKAGASARYSDRTGKRMATAEQPHSIARAGLPLPEPEPIAAQQVISESEKDQIERLRGAFGGEPSDPDVTPILALIDKGYDLAKDILPVIRARVAKATKPIGSWRYFVAAIEEARAANGAIKPNGAIGTPSAPVTWVRDDSPRWTAIAERYQREKGRPLLARGSTQATGLGAFVSSAWLAADLAGRNFPPAPSELQAPAEAGKDVA